MLSKAKMKRIHSLARKKVRDELGLFVAEGPKGVDEILRAPNAEAVDILATAQWLQDSALLSSRRIDTTAVTEIDESELKNISGLSTPNQVLAVFRKPVFSQPPIYSGRLTLLLDSIQDPGNLGTIIRCADWFGIENVVCSHTCADAFNAKVVQSTMGSIARVRVIYEDLPAFIGHHGSAGHGTDEIAVSSGIPIYAAALDGTSLQQIAPVQEGFLLIGNESRGISDELLARAHQHITIPRAGNAESLNAAVATGIILSHLVTAHV